MPRKPSVVRCLQVAGYSEQISWLREEGAPTRVTKKQIQTAVDGSLARLDTDCIDLLQVHWPDRYVPLFGQAGYDVEKRRDAVSFEEQLEGLQTVIDQGKVLRPCLFCTLDSEHHTRAKVPFFPHESVGCCNVVQVQVKYIGVSNETSFGVMEFIRLAEQAGLPRIHSIQNSFSLLVRLAWEMSLSEVRCPSLLACRQIYLQHPLEHYGLQWTTRLVQVCLEQDVSLLAYSPLASGTLTGKYIKGEHTDKSRLHLFPGFMDRYNESLARTATTEYMKVWSHLLRSPVGWRSQFGTYSLAVSLSSSRRERGSQNVGLMFREGTKRDLHLWCVQVAEEEGIDVGTMALAWCQTRPLTASTIIGATTMDQLKANLDAFDVDLSDDCVAAIDQVNKKYKDPSTFA